MIKLPKYVVKENPNLYRDGYSKAIINNDIASLNEHKQKAKISNELEKNSKKIENFEIELKEIKQLLTMLINKH